MIIIRIYNCKQFQDSNRDRDQQGNSTMSRIRFHSALMALGIFALNFDALAAGVHFENPASASWGNWERGDAGTLYAHWDKFVAPDFTSIPVDTTPDKGKLGLKDNLGAALFTAVRNEPDAAPQAFITGSNNIYSFADTLAFQILLQPQAAHEATIGQNPVIVALQVSVLGEDLDDSTVTLHGGTFLSKKVLHAANASNENGGVDNEYLYLFEFPIALSIYVLDFAAADPSLSLDAVSVDIGPAPMSVIDPPPLPTPLPAPVWLLGAASALLVRARRRQRSGS